MMRLTQLGVVLSYLVHGVYTLCVNQYGDAFCNNEAAIGECWLDARVPCRCAMACDYTPSCPGATQDQDCYCQAVTGYCNMTSMRNLCPTTCQRRDTVVCDPLEVVPNASPSDPSPLYLTLVTYTCEPGYYQTGGQDGLRICKDDGSWVISTRNGTTPVCEAVSCEAPPVIPGYDPSAPTGVYPDVITYDCTLGTLKQSGGTARHICNTTGDWIQDATDTMPVCVDETNHYTTSVSEIDLAATPILTTMSARSGLECASLCSRSAKCEGYTYNMATRTCQHNVGPYLPIVTEMRRVYTQT